MLLFFVHLRSQQKRTEKVISNYQIYSVAILTFVILRVAIISNVQRRHRPTDDASTCRWRGSQQTGPFRTTRRSDTRAAGRRPRNK